MGWNRHPLPMLMVVSWVWLAFPFVANARDSLPNWTVTRPQTRLIPGDSPKYVAVPSQDVAEVDGDLLDGGGSMALMSEAGTTLDAEIKALARGLRYDAGMIYRFVHDHIQFEPMWGEFKGAKMALMDRSGTPFDQAALAIALLTEAAGAAEAPHTITAIQYVVGKITIEGPLFANWFGIPDDASVAASILVAAGVPEMEVHSNPDGTIDYVRFEHVWVKATIDGQIYRFDPSLKSHSFKTGLTQSQLETAMGYTESAFFSSATDGATIQSDYVKDLNTANISSSLTTYATNLVDYIQTNHPAGDLADIIGGKTIIPAAESTLPPMTLPYTTTSTEAFEWGDPDLNPYRTKLRIRHRGINQTCFTSEVYGRRLMITYNENRQPVLTVDGVQLGSPGTATTLGKEYDLTIKASHVYDSGDQERTCKVKAGGMWIIVNGWGNVGTRIIEQHRRILQQNRHDGFADDSDEVLGESFTLTGLTWAAECCRVQALVSQISGCTAINHHLVGVVGQYQAPYIDMPMCQASIVSHTGSSEAETAAFLAVGGQWSAYEHGVIHQLQDYGAVSTVKLMDIANDRTTYDKVFQVTSANWSSIKSQLQQPGHGYSAAEIDDVNSLVDDGYTIYLPEYGDLQEEDWKGVGYLATRLQAGSWAAKYGISGGYNGGYLGKDNPWNVVRQVERKGFILKIHRDSPKSTDPIDLVTGACTYDHTDIAVGNGGFPLGLQLERQYNSIQRLEDGPMGMGWTHGFDITTKVTSDSFQAMGEDSPIDAAANVTALYITCDMFRQPCLVNNMVASLSEKWLMDQMIDNIVVVKQGHEAMEFVKLPDGSFNPPPGKAAKLVKEADNTYLLKDRAGNLLDFDSNNRAVRWSDPHGNLVDLAYTDGKLSNVTSKIGGSVASRSLTFTYDVNHIDTVTDSAGRSISFDYDAAGNLTGYADPEEHVTTFQYYGDGDPNEGLMWKVFYPDRPTEPYAIHVYDPLGRVIRQTNAAGHVYDYFYSHYRTEELEPSQTPPSGPAARYSKLYYFDDHGRTVAVKDQLGRRTTTEYDGQQRPERVVSPAGTSVEYSYDLNHNIVETRGKPIDDSALPDIAQSATYATHEAAGRWFNRLTSQTDAAGNTTTYEYDFSNPAYGTEYGDLRKVTSPQVTDYRGQTVTVTQQFTYNAYGQPETVTDANGIVTKFEYYPPAQGAGLQRTIVDFGTGQEHLNLTTEVTYDNVGNVLSVTDPQGNMSQSEYFPSRRLMMTIAPAPFHYRTGYEYYPDGKLHYVTQLPAGVGNDFTDDPNCVAVYRFESEGFTSDSSANGNTLTNVNAVVASATAQEGSQSADFENLSRQYMYRPEADLSPDFPLKSSGTQRNMSVCAWVRLESTGTYKYVFHKGDIVGKWGLGVIITPANNARIFFGYNGGADPQIQDHGSALSANKWYHIVATYQDATKAYRLSVWDDEAGAILGTDLTGTALFPVNVEEASFFVGSGTGGAGPVYTWDGLLDEVAVFNDVLTSEEIDRIRQGTYVGNSTVVLQDLTYTAAGEPATRRGPYPENPTPEEYAANFTQYAYDTLERPWTVTDAEDHTTETRYWPDGQVLKTIDAEGHDAITNTYNADGSLYSVQDAKGNETVYDYDDFKRPWRTWYADDTYEEISYDAFGRVYQTTTRAGDTAQRTYDALSRTVSRTLAGNTTTYGYDISGRTVTTTDNAGTLRSTFDRIGRVSIATQTNGASVSYLYDELGQRTRLTYPDQSFITYVYDTLGRLTDIDDQSTANIAHYEYDDLSRRVSVSYANGTSASYTYNNSDRLTQIANAGLSQPSTYSYSYDLVGNRTGMLVNGAEQHVYTYDDIYQLTNVDYPQDYFQPDTTFTYDDAGNRSGVDSPPTTYQTNNLNQYTFVGSEAFDYDNNGNLTNDGHSAYTYDAENRLVSAAVADRTIQYTYDAAGRRIRKVANGRTTQYVYDGDEVIAEYDGEDALLRTFVYGPGIDEPICMHAYAFAFGDLTGDGSVNIEDLRALATHWLTTDADSGYDPLCDLNQDGRIDNADTDLLSAHWKKTAPAVQVFYYHFDGLGSVVTLSDAAGTVVETYAYDVYGRCRTAGLSHGNPYRFTARRWEPETGLYDYRARYYNPQIGRFLQTDPLGYADGINWYAYCGNNPIIWVDPWGLGSELAKGSVGAPGFWGGLIPVYGSARSAINDFQEGRYIWGGVNLVLAATDVIGAKALVTAGGKLIAKGGAKAIAAVTAKRVADSYADDVLKAGGKAAKNSADDVLRAGGKGTSQIDRSAFRVEREAFWKAEAANNPGKYTADDLARMRKGRAPLGKDGNPMELHHIDRTPEGGVTPKTRTDHRLGDNYKKNHP